MKPTRFQTHLKQDPDAVLVQQGNVYLLKPSLPSYYTIEDIYDPSQTYPDNEKLIVPPVGSLISGDGTEPNVLYIVTAVDSTTYAPTLQQIYMPTNQDGFGMSSVLDYGNTQFRAYYDTRSTPYTVTIGRVVFYGGSPSTYTLTRYPNTSQETVVSLYYNESGTFSGNSVPMVSVSSDTNVWYCQTCNIDFIPELNEELLIKVYSETGALVATCSVYCEPADIINTALNYRPKIQNLTVQGTQPLSTGGFYLYEKQKLSDLALYGVLTFDNGTTQQIQIDGLQTILFGENDFVASYCGLKQYFLLKYNLSYNQTVANPPASDVEVTSTSISRMFTVSVIANQLAVPIKISVIPMWDSTLAQYTLQYFYYSTDHDKAVQITSNVSINNGTFQGNGYINWQTFTITVDMNTVDSVNYPTPANYTQSVAIKLQPPAALVRYLIADSVSSPVIYGTDSSACRRPLLYYDSTVNQYFVSSLLFQNTSAVLEAFYYNANPPYDSNTETAVPVPTHFTVRNPTNGGLILASPISLANYDVAFSLINGQDGEYVGGTLIVEFWQVNGSNQQFILYGVPVDVSTATYIAPSTTKSSTTTTTSSSTSNASTPTVTAIRRKK